MVTDRLTDEELRRVTTDDAQAHLGELQDWVAETHRPVVVERDGKTPSVLISYEEFAAFREAQRAQRIANAIAELEQLAKDVSSRPANQDLTDDDAWELGKRALNETLEEMEVEGKIRFER